MRLETERTGAHGHEVVARLRAMFGARSVALVGATDKSQWSKTTYENLRTFSPDVDVHLVHPQHQRSTVRPPSRRFATFPARSTWRI